MKVADLFAQLSLKTDKKSFAAADRLLGGLKTAIGGLIAFKSIQSFSNMIKETVDNVSHFVDVSQQLGVGIEPLQQLGFVAGQSGVEMGSLETSLRKLAKASYDASKGSKQQKKVFKELGVSVKDTKGKLRPVEEILGDVADRIAEMPDGTAKTALAMKTFGRAGAQLIPMLNLGGDGIREMRKEFELLGGQVSDKDARAIEDFGDQLEKLKEPVKGIKNQITIALLPTLKKVVAAFITWVKQPKNMEKIRKVTKKIADGIVFLLNKFVKFGKWVYTNWPKIIAVIAKLGKAIGFAFALKKIFEFSKAVSAIALGPFGLIVAGATLIAKLLAVAFDVDIVTVFSAALDTVVELIETAIKGYQEIVDFADRIRGKGGKSGKEGFGVAQNETTGRGREIRKKFKGKSDAELMNAPGFAKEDAQRELHYRANDRARQDRRRAQKEASGFTSTPAAPNRSGGGVSLNAPMNLTINAPSGDSKEIGNQVTKVVRQFWDSKMRDLQAATGE